jgi:hypothetical protein
MYTEQWVVCTSMYQDVQSNPLKSRIRWDGDQLYKVVYTGMYRFMSVYSSTVL